MSRALDELSPAMRPLAFELLARCTEAGLPVVIVCTGRTIEEQTANIAAGVSWTAHSKHLTGDAIDIAPYDIFLAHGPDKLAWDASLPVWQKLGALGEAIGLTWGGRWKQRDMGHFQLP